MDFTLPPSIEHLRQSVHDFVHQHILPVEQDRAHWDAHDNIRLDTLNQLRERAKAQRLWAPQVPQEWGGMGLPMTAWAALYEEANYSLFGPCVFNCAAPDDGNMNLLAKRATEAQKKQWLTPIVEGQVRSAFVMTEPHPGGGSDPGMIKTRAEKTPTGWRIHGHKWFITGAEEASHFILIARTSDDPRKGLTAFLYHKDQPGWSIKRRIEIMGPEEHGGHCEVLFDGLEVQDENVLGLVGDGLKLTQVRLGPARLTHCMRWLGLSKRCMEIAQDYANERSGFGMRLADRESIRIKLGGLAMDIEIGRLLVMRAAWLLDQGDFARKAISMAKVHVADTLHKAADIGIQINGARGYSRDTILEWIYRYARQARLVDGATEVHQMVLADAYAREGHDFWHWGTPGPSKRS